MPSICFAIALVFCGSTAFTSNALRSGFASFLNNDNSSPKFFVTSSNSSSLERKVIDSTPSKALIFASNSSVFVWSAAKSINTRTFTSFSISEPILLTLNSSDTNTPTINKIIETAETAPNVINPFLKRLLKASRI